NKIVRDWRLYWTFAALVTGAILILVAEIASAFDSLERVTLVLTWLGVDAALLYLIARKFKSETFEILLVRKEGGGLKALIQIVKHRIIELDRPTRWIYSFGAGFALILGVISWQAPTF